jgi:hypothetical protein
MTIRCGLPDSLLVDCVLAVLINEIKKRLGAGALPGSEPNIYGHND